MVKQQYPGMQVKPAKDPLVRVADDVARRRLLEAQRVERLRNHKGFTIGQDVAALDAQVEAKRQQDALNKKQEDDLSNQMNQIDQKLRYMELEKQRAHKKWEENVAAFNSSIVGTSDTADLNLKHPLRDQCPTRVGDDDPKISISSFQQFEGEDLSSMKRKHRQQQQMRGIIEQQVVEKAILKQQEDAIEAEHAERMNQIHQLRSAVETEEIALRKKIEQIRHDGNAEACEIKKRNEEAINGMSSKANEIEHKYIAQSTFLNELPKAPRTDGRPDIPNFKGHDKDIWIQCQQDQLAQVEAKKAKANADKNESLFIDNLATQCRTKVTHEMFEAGKRKKNLIAAMQEENRKMAEEKAAAKKQAQQDAIGESFVGEQFLSRWGSSAR